MKRKLLLFILYFFHIETIFFSPLHPANDYPTEKKLETTQSPKTDVRKKKKSKSYIKQLQEYLTRNSKIITGSIIASCGIYFLLSYQKTPFSRPIQPQGVGAAPTTLNFKSLEIKTHTLPVSSQKNELNCLIRTLFNLFSVIEEKHNNLTNEAEFQTFHQKACNIIKAAIEDGSLRPENEDEKQKWLKGQWLNPECLKILLKNIDTPDITKNKIIFVFEEEKQSGHPLFQYHYWNIETQTFSRASFLDQKEYNFEQTLKNMEKNSKLYFAFFSPRGGGHAEAFAIAKDEQETLHLCGMDSWQQKPSFQIFIDKALENIKYTPETT